MARNKLGPRVRSISSEHVFLIVTLLSSSFMFFVSFNFSRQDGIFPRYTSGIVMVGSLLLIFRNYLPEFLSRLASEDVSISGEEEIEEKPTEAGEEMNNEQATQDNRYFSDMFAASIMIIGYTLFSYLFGILWASPVFTVIYLSWFNVKWYMTLSLSILSFVIPYVFMEVLILPFDKGILFKGGVL